MQIIHKFYKPKPDTIYQFYISGPINSHLNYKVRKLINTIKIHKTLAISVIINSQGGSHAQAYNLYQKFNQIREYHKIPIYTFAEDYALHSALLLLSLGDKIYVDESSIIGANTQISQWKVQKLLNKHDIDITEFNNQNTILEQLNPITNTKDDGQIQAVNDSLHGTFTKLIKQNLKSIPDDLLEGQIFLGNEVNGFIIDNPQNVLQQLHPGAKVVNLEKQTGVEMIEEIFLNLLKERKI
ncbi:hypothetical protein pb186bvf_001846 [Paramecium bursaria]